MKNILIFSKIFFSVYGWTWRTAAQSIIGISFYKPARNKYSWLRARFVFVVFYRSDRRSIRRAAYKHSWKYVNAIFIYAATETPVSRRNVFRCSRALSSNLFPFSGRRVDSGWQSIGGLKNTRYPTEFVFEKLVLEKSRGQLCPARISDGMESSPETQAAHGPVASTVYPVWVCDVLAPIAQ